MERLEPDQLRLVASQLAGFVSHISWRPGEGWRVYVSSWNEGQLPTSGLQSSYTHLTADEALDVLQAELFTRCEWLEPDLSP